ncbi:MAG: 6-hydroxymethylpterin diphosphokinase MptE-like protein [Cycloclasticus sp.]
MAGTANIDAMSKSNVLNKTDLEGWAESANAGFELTVNKTRLLLEQNLRFLPGRRLTCRAKWQGQQVIAKLFYGAGFKRYLTKELLVLKALEKAGINTPALLQVDEQVDCGVLIIEYLDKATALSACFNADSDAEVIEPILTDLTSLVLECQRASFEIKDPHLDNFLLSNGRIRIIDAGDIQLTAGPLEQSKAMANMALLYAQFPVTLDDIAYRVLQKVLNDQSRWQGLEQTAWQQLLIKQRRWRIKKFIDKKVFRNCTAFICQKNQSRFMVAKRELYSEQMAVALQNPDDLISAGHLLKNGNTATVAVVEIAGQRYVLKRYNIKKPIHALIRGLIWSRAAVSWRNGLSLEMLGIPTAKSYALIEERWGPMRRRSYLLTEFVNAPNAKVFFEGNEVDESIKIKGASDIVDIMYLLERAEISHGDLKGQNILCTNAGPKLIDLDGLKSNLSNNNFQRKYRKDIHRFLASWRAEGIGGNYFKELTSNNDMDSRKNLLRRLAAFLFQLDSIPKLKRMSFKVYRWSLPRAYKHIAISGPDFNLSDDDNYELGKKVFWREKKIANTQPLKEVVDSASGSCFIVGSGPSIKNIDFSKLKGKVLFGVNGSVEIFKSNDLTPDYYAITDVDFFENRFDLVEDAVRSKAKCFFSYGGISRICEKAPELLNLSNIYLSEIINRQFSAPRLRADVFQESIKNDKNIISSEKAINHENVVGFSKDINQGLFCSRTILYRAIQIAYAAGYRKIYLLGLDLGYSDEPRFYSEGGNVRPSKLEKDYKPFIEPAFEVLSRLVKNGELEVYNLSDKSRLPENIIARKKFDEVISEARNISEA